MEHPLGSGYNFFTWADQLKDFSESVVKDAKGVFCICNSIGSCAGTVKGTSERKYEEVLVSSLSLWSHVNEYMIRVDHQDCCVKGIRTTRMIMADCKCDV